MIFWFGELEKKNFVVFRFSLCCIVAVVVFFFFSGVRKAIDYKLNYDSNKNDFF